MIIKTQRLPKIGDRDDFSICLQGPGDTNYEFPVSITRTVSSIWGVVAEDAVKNLVACLFKVSGTAKAPPNEGFWFDSYNSGVTVEETKNKILNLGIKPFTKASINTTFTIQFGKILFNLKEDLNQFFVENYKEELFKSFEDAFEDSQAIEDLNTPPKDKAHFLFKICILSVFIDHLRVSSAAVIQKCLLCGRYEATGSLQKFKVWLTIQLGSEDADRLTQCFQMVKNLRKQYPIHEEYEIQSTGNRKLRPALKKAQEYFDLSSDYATDWLRILNKFVESLKKIKEALTEKLGGLEN